MPRQLLVIKHEVHNYIMQLCNYDIKVYIKFIDNNHVQNTHLSDLTVTLLQTHVYFCRNIEILYIGTDICNEKFCNELQINLDCTSDV